jgi:hypothetical protein
VRLNPDNKRWTVVDCDIGGRKGDRRILAVYLVGESGKALIRYFRDASRVHNATNEKLRKFPDEKIETLPLIVEKTRDMIKCAEVLVVRE